ncbi:hypothetical protein BH11MYX3_BH11MYX3_11330 [soil metagenome]
MYRCDVSVQRGEPERELRQEVGETTDELPRVVRARRTLHFALGAFGLAMFGLAALFTVRPPVGGSAVPPEATAAIDAEAQRLGMIIETTTKSVHLQAETMSGGPQIRAGVMTDAATVKDLVTTELQLPRNLNQTLEMLQIREGSRSVLLTVPEGAPPIAPGSGGTRFVIDGRKQLAVVVAAPIAPYDPASTITGVLVLSTPLDFTLTRENLAAYAARIELAGDHCTSAIASDSGAAAEPIQRRLALEPAWGVAPLTLEFAPRLRAATARWVDPVRFTAGGLGLVLALVLGLSLIRTRSP